MTSDEDKRALQIHNLKKKLSFYFPEDAHTFTQNAVEEGLDSGSIMTTPADILPYVQTALIDNKILEVELNGADKIYFSRMNDEPPDPEVMENDQGEFEMMQPDYPPGEYLKSLNHIICLPLEPGMGNHHIRSSEQVMIRFFTSSSAIELGTSFQKLTEIQGLPVLQLSFPAIARQIEGARAFRAKVPGNMAFTLIIKGKKKLGRPNIDTVPIDISAAGMSFEIQREEQKLFQEEEICNIRFFLDTEMHLKVNAKVRHISKIRNRSSIQYCCGVEFDIESRSMASSVEGIVASVQRAHLKELAELSEASGISMVR
ncbi:MAG: PilZ domain-containing protein [Desulfocapsa sp.]|nr:PilZ domain-containing protein [Desulfocapsa sp.]